MLFVLTGDVQTGKTRWLEQLVAILDAKGIGAQGVIAPGIWRSGDCPDAMLDHVDANGFEKLGIDNVLLPQGERIAFARRRDIAEAEGLLDPNAESEKAHLLWHIDDAAIGHVNAHLAALPHPDPGKPSLLVIDELGRLELERGRGLVEALRLLDCGPTAAFPHALVVVRAALFDHIADRFPLWGEPVPIHPDRESTETVQRAFGM